jgi:hypothetical protein
MFIEENTKEERKAVDVVRKTYKDFNVEDISNLYFNLRLEPSRYFELLTGKKVDINYMVIIYRCGFDLCTTYKFDEKTYLSRCFGIYKNEKRITYNLYAVPIPVCEVYNNVDYDYDKLLDRTVENPEVVFNELAMKYVFGG